MDNQRKGKRKDPHETDDLDGLQSKASCATKTSLPQKRQEEIITWKEFRRLNAKEQKEVPGVSSWRMNVGTVYKFDGKWISFRHLTDDQWAAIGNNWHPNFQSMYGDWDDEVNRCVNFSHEETKVMAIPSDNHDTKYIMSSAVILEDHYKNEYDPPEEEIGIVMYLERKDFELDSNRSSF